jgi:BirA family biotin operon repressor/biotin-[acetyl-CoA-carboxylase] ligase
LSRLVPPAALGPLDYERALASVGLTEIAVFHRATTGSTNDDAKEIASSRSPSLDLPMAIVVAEEQTRGRGRGGNAWLSPRGSISFTITAPGVQVSRLGVLPLGVGACVAGALKRLGASAFLKWPNDVLIGARKVSGILCESSLSSRAARVFLGIGLNVDVWTGDPQLTSTATTLAAQGIEASRPALIADIAQRVVALLASDAPNAEVVENWRAAAVPWWGEEVTFVESGIQKRVTLLDVDAEGRLVVREGDGAVRSLLSGVVGQLRSPHA